jgi:hypothetical protein
MCDKELLVGHLYDELSPPEQQEFERHVAVCRDCREEVESLRATRTQLALWGPPEPALGFEPRLEVVQRPTARSRYAISPVWGLAAAAVLVLAAATALANLDVHVGRDGLRIRTGWTRDAASSTQPATLPASSVVSADETTRAELQAILQRVGELERQLSAQPPTGASVVAVKDGRPRLTDAELMRRVGDLLAESEKRQESVLASRVVQVMRELEAAYRTDLVRLQQGFTRNQGLRDAEVIRQGQMLNEVFRLVGSQQR